MTPLSLVPARCPDDCLACHLRAQRRGCGGALTAVEQWCVDHAVDQRVVTRFVQSQGGSCDCEVLDNALSEGRCVLDDVVLSCHEQQSRR